MADSFEQNILGVTNLVESKVNKTFDGNDGQEGTLSEPFDVLELPMDDSELLELRDSYMLRWSPYAARIKPRQEQNKTYYQGRQKATGENDQPVPNNLIFESQETFIPQALSKNPEPVVWSDNTDEGKTASNDIKTMLQYHADVLCLRKKLGMLVRHWSVYFIGVVKHGWDAKIGDITLEIRKPQNFILDPDGYVDEYGNFIGEFIGEKIESTAKKLIEMFPDKKDYITLKVDGKLGTTVIRTEWWNDDFCFTTFEEEILDKHKNEYFNYEEGKPNHFATPKMPYTFLSVFSLQEAPHDITNLIEQNLSNQDRVNERDAQISKNLKVSNNSLVVSGLSFNSETAREAAIAVEDGDPIISPNGDTSAVVRLPAPNLPSAIFQAQDNDKNSLRSIFGVQGLSYQSQNEDTTARGMILNQSHDSTRIGGGIGDALEQVADNIFNWQVQLYAVFYDEDHYAAVMGTGAAVGYSKINSANLNRKFVVSVAPNSMQPKDEITEQNLAIDLANKGWLDPINLFKKLNYPDPMETAKMVTLFKIDPAMYMQQFFPEIAPPQPMGGIGNPTDIGLETQGEQTGNLGAPPASPDLGNVPLSTEALPQ